MKKRINRRQFGLSAAGLAAATVLPSRQARSQSPTMFRLANAAGLNDPQQIFLTAGRHPRLGFYKAEGVDFDLFGVANPSQGMQAVATGEATLASLTPGLFIPVVAKEPSFPVIATYCWLPRNASTIAVKPDAPFRTIVDLRGKRIGIRNQGDIGRVVVKTMLREMGLDDSGTEYIAIGDGGAAGTALYSDRVDAIASFDTACARVELAGFKLRYIPLTPRFAATPSAYFGFNKKWISEKRRELVGFTRALAKSTIFARTNPEVSIEMHWEQYPESKPKSKSEAEAKAEMMFILKQRMENWMPRPDNPDQRMGATNAAEWTSLISIASETTNDPELSAKIGDPHRLFTSELIDEINAFDKEAIIRQAKEFKI